MQLNQQKQIIKDSTVEIIVQNGQQIVKIQNSTQFMSDLINLINNSNTNNIFSKQLSLKTQIKNGSLDFAEVQRIQPQQVLQYQAKITNIMLRATFTNMEYLYLWSTKLNNCQFLMYLDAPCLKNIYLSTNKFTSLKPLNKAHIPAVQILNIQSNYVFNFDLSRLKCPIFTQSLVIQFSDGGNVLNEDLSKLLKLQADFYDRFRIQSKLRIKQQIVRQQLKKRFVKIEYCQKTKIVQLL